jgi:hypothetical protein
LKEAPSNLFHTRLRSAIEIGSPKAPSRVDNTCCSIVSEISVSGNDIRTFLACVEELISRSALAPLSRASGSNPTADVRGASFLGFSISFAGVEDEEEAADAVEGEEDGKNEPGSKVLSADTGARARRYDAETIAAAAPALHSRAAA